MTPVEIAATPAIVWLGGMLTGLLWVGVIAAVIETFAEEQREVLRIIRECRE